MKKSFSVDSTFNDMRIDRWIRNNLGNIPQSLIEKSLRSGKIKLNNKKIKSSQKVKTEDTVELFNFDYTETIVQKKIKFVPSEEVIKEISPQLKSKGCAFWALSQKCSAHCLLRRRLCLSGTL